MITIEQLEAELKEKDRIIAKLSDENDVATTELHKFTHKVSALHTFAQGLSESEHAAEFADVIDTYNRITNEYYTEISQKLPQRNVLPLTNVKSIDILLGHLCSVANNANIEFLLKVTDSVNLMIQKIVSESTLETLIGDLVNNAIRAINASDNVRRSILVSIGVADGCYELCVFDSGLEFDADVLRTLGQEQKTTHSAAGGTGIGFITTFETLDEYKASLIIMEKSPKSSNYTKSLTIRFDNKHQYIIKSYRADMLKTLSDEEGRIIIQDV